MPAKARFFHRARVHAPVDVCWDVFTDHDRMGEFSAMAMPVIVAGKADRNGLGCVRRMEAWGMVVEEIVNYWHPHEIYGYRQITSPSATHHQGIVRFWRLPDGGTEWVYDMQLVPTEDAEAFVLKSGAASFRGFMSGGFAEYMCDLESECERRASRIAVPAAPLSILERDV